MKLLPRHRYKKKTTTTTKKKKQDEISAKIWQTLAVYINEQSVVLPTS